MPYAQIARFTVQQTTSAFLALALLTLSACNDGNGKAPGSGSPPPAAVAPSITIQPADQTTTAGQAVTFTVAASGTAPLVYQWQRGGANIAGATDSTYTLASASTSDTGAKFTVLVSNSAGSVTSNPAMLTVTAPANLLGSSGGKASSDDQGIVVTVAPAALKGDTMFSFKALTGLTNLPAGYVLVSGTAYEIDWNGAGFVGSSQVTLSFVTPQGQTSRVQKLQRVNHQAQRRGSTGSTGAVVQCGDSSQVYDVSVDPNASSYSDATAILCDPNSSSGSNSSSQSQTGLVQPQSGSSLTITSQPTDETVTADTEASFRVVAQSSSSISYQWLVNGVNIPNANSAAYSFNAQLSDSGNKYSVVVTDAGGSLTSSNATLTVTPPQKPAAPQWSDIAVITDFGVNVGAPQIGVPAGTSRLLAWNDNGVLGSDNAAINARALPIQGTPVVLSGPNLALGYIVYIDDDGTGGCPTGSGNRLSAIATAFTFESGVLPPSDPVAIFPPDPNVGCIQSFAAGIGLDYVSKVFGAVTFALTASNNGITTGIAAIYNTNSVTNGLTTYSYTHTTPTSAPLPTSADCSSPALLSSDQMRGVAQALSPPDPNLNLATHSTTPIATLAFVSSGPQSGFVCAAQFDGATWSMATGVIANANLETEPTVAIDANGDSLVLASVLVDPTATTLSYAMTAAYRGGADTAWQPSHPFDAKDAPALPSAAFDYNGNAFLVWRPNSGSGTSQVYAARMSAGGIWTAPEQISAATTVETRYPRVTVDDRGNALALFEQSDTGAAPFTVVSTVWSQGLWSDIATVQTDGNDGRFADAPRNAEVGQGLEIAWRENDPTDSTGSRTRIVASQMLSGPYTF